MESGLETVSAFAMYSMNRKKEDHAPKLKRLTSKKKNSLDVTSLYKEKKNKSSKPSLNTNNFKNISKNEKLKEQIKYTIDHDKSIIKLVNKPQVSQVTGSKCQKTNVVKADKAKKVDKLTKVEKSLKVLKPTNLKKNKKLEKIDKKKLKRARISKSNDLQIMTGEKIENNSNHKKSVQRVKKLKKKQSLDERESIYDEINSDPITKSKSCFEWLISPFNVDQFLNESWEQQPVHIKRKNEDYYKFLMSTPMLDSILRENNVLFMKNIDVTSYTDGVRETHNPPGRALPSIVWDYYENGCSIRMLNPQTFITQLHELNAILQEFFGCFVGANSYLTPPNSQGFAPHFDDIEAFILQIEGKKRWRLYKPRDEDFLARFPSKNFDQSEIGKPIMDMVLNAGDLLYFPRGTIHQGETIDDTHSLHITLSVYQKNSWTDLFEKLLSRALKSSSKVDFRFREGLPIGTLRHVGLAHSGDKSTKRKAFLEKVKFLLEELMKHVDVDEAADQVAKGHLHDFLPPVLWDQELENSVLKDGWVVRNAGVVEEKVDIEPETRIRLVRSHCVRLVEEEDAVKIYYSTENSREYHEYEPQFFEIDRHLIPAIREIILQYPNYIKVEDLPTSDIDVDVKVGMVHDLWEKCIVVTDRPLRRVV